MGKRPAEREGRALVEEVGIKLKQHRTKMEGRCNSFRCITTQFTLNEKQREGRVPYLQVSKISIIYVRNKRTSSQANVNVNENL